MARHVLNSVPSDQEPQAAIDHLKACCDHLASFFIEREREK